MRNTLVSANIKLGTQKLKDMEELTQEQQDFLTKRLDLLKYKRDKLKEIKSLHQWEEASEFISTSFAQEDARLKFDDDNYTDSTIIGLRNANSKMKSVVSLMLKKKENKAADPFWGGIDELTRDYNTTIRHLEEKINLKRFFAKTHNG